MRLSASPGRSSGCGSSSRSAGDRRRRRLDGRPPRRRSGQGRGSCACRARKGQALTLAEREAPPGAIVVCDADLDGDLRPLAAAEAGLAIAVFAERQGGASGSRRRLPVP